MISNLSDGELFVPFPSEEKVKEEPGEPTAPDLDSPMSEPPASPTRTKSPVQKEEDEETEINDIVEATAEVELSTSQQSTPSLQQPREVQEKEEEEEEEEQEEEEEEEEQTLPSDHGISIPPSPRSPSRPGSTSLHHSPAPSRHSSRPRSPPVPPQSPQFVSVEPVTEVVEMDTSEPMEDIREESPQLVLPSSSPVFAQTTEIHVQSGETAVDIEATAAPSPSPVQEAPPRPMVIHTAVDVVSIQPSLLIPTPTSPAPALPDFSFEDGEGEALEEPLQPIVSTEIQHHFNPDYNLPPLKALPPEYLRKGKSSKQKKKDKDKTDTKGGKEEWAPLGFAKWGAIIRANPIYKKVSRATKCLSTKDWSVCVFPLLWLFVEHLRFRVGRNHRTEADAHAGARRISRKCGEVEL